MEIALPSVEAVWSASRVVPKGLLDRDTQAMAARGDDRCLRMLDAIRPLFVRLAETAPGLVTIDLEQRPFLPDQHRRLNLDL